jgi:hypothetical protein
MKFFSIGVIQRVGGRDIAFKWSSSLESLKSRVRENEGDIAQHSTGHFFRAARSGPSTSMHQTAGNVVAGILRAITWATLFCGETLVPNVLLSSQPNNTPALSFDLYKTKYFNLRII